MNARPQPDPDRIVRWPLHDFLAAYPPVYRGTWPKVVAAFQADEFDRETVDRLRTAWRQTGRFWWPVRVDGNGFGDGQHRVTALILERAEHIDVTDEPEPELGEEWEVSFATAGGPLDHDDPLLDRLLYAVRAFPLGDEWIQGYLAGTGGRQRVIAVIPPGQQHALRREVLTRARRAGLHPTRVKLVRVVEPEPESAAA